MISGSTLQEAIDSYPDCVVYPDCHDMTDIAYEVVESAGLLDTMLTASTRRRLSAAITPGKNGTKRLRTMPPS